MTLFELCSVLITLAALFSYINFKYLRLPTTIGIMLIALASSLVLIVLGRMGHRVHDTAAVLVGGIDFHAAVLHGMLAFLLFAGSLHLDLADLKKEWGVISVLALVGTAVSTVIVGYLAWIAFRWIGIAMPPVYCFLLGALISPTDPIAVLGIMKNVGAAKDMETQVAGESLFNDGVGVVIFLALLNLVSGTAGPSWSGMAIHLLREVLGGVALGLAEGVFVYRLLKRVDHYQVEVLLTLALAMGGFTLAEVIHVSAPIAVVVAGLFIGNQGRSFAISPITELHLDTFWELIDEVLNALLFLLIGLEVLVMVFTTRLFVAGLVAIAITLLARWISVAGVVIAMQSWRSFRRGTITVLTWGGLRGGLSVAMALSLPLGEQRDVIVAVTYCVVVFSIFAQGLSVGAVIRRVSASADAGSLVPAGAGKSERIPKPESNPKSE
jgi:Na+:H+ antiporter